MEFGNRVRAHPGGLLITAANKMRSSSRVRAGFSGTISETVSFDTASSECNLEEFASFFRELPTIEPQNGRYIWTDVEGAKIAALMGRVDTSRDSWKANSRAISDYIVDRVEHGRLVSWTVVLVARGRSSRQERIGPYSVALTERANRSEGEPGKFTIGRLVSPADEMLDLDPEQKEEALRETVEAWQRKTPPKGEKPDIPAGPFIRRQRDVEHGLLIVYPIDPGKKDADPLMGFAVSFPFDHQAPLIDYAENSVKQLEELFA